MVELDEGFPVNKTFDVQRRDGHKVAFGLTIGKRQGEQSVADLFYLDRTGEGSFLSIISFQLLKSQQTLVAPKKDYWYLDTMLIVPDAIRCYRWMMARRRSGRILNGISWHAHLTCSLTSRVSPASSCHFPI